tara:strand:+ start:2167 stop:2829 length:663 start_codon:yes stop_codon:yes gene_type:complete
MSDLTNLFNPFQSNPQKTKGLHPIAAHVLNVYFTLAGTVKWPSTGFLPQGDNEHFGLFDYATLGIPYLINKATYYTGITATNAIKATTNLRESNQQSRLELLAIIPIVPLMVLNAVLSALRFVLAASLTSPLTPFIGIYHGGSKLINFIKQFNEIQKEQTAEALSVNQYNQAKTRLHISAAHKTNGLGKNLQPAYFDCGKYEETKNTADNKDISRANLPR